MFSLAQLAKKDLFSSPVRVLVGISTISIAIIVSTTALVLFFILQQLITGQYRGTATSDLALDIYPKFSVGFLRVTKSEQQPLSQDLVEALKQRPDVARVFAEETLTYPATLTLSLFNTAFETDSPIYALPDELFATYQDQELTDKKHIPVLISKHLVDLYNLGIAQAINKPQLNEDILKGWGFDITTGRSSLFSSANGTMHNYKGEVVGITEQVTMVGITIPMSALRMLQEDIGLTPEEYYINKIRVEATSREALPALQQYIEAQGYDTSSLSKERSATALHMSAMMLAFMTGMLLLLLLVFLSLFLLFWSHVHEKRTLYAILRIHGATTWDITKLLIFQLGYLMGVGVLIGTVTGAVLLMVLYMGVLLPLSPTLVSASLYVQYVLWSSVWSIGLMVILGILSGLSPYLTAKKQTPESLLIHSGR